MIWLTLFTLYALLVGMLYQIPTWMQRLYRGVTWRRVTHGERVVYLTFDDGCIPQVTPAILDVLVKYGVKATFFMVGENIQKYPQLYARVVAEGHRVGNHTYHHCKGSKCSTEQYMREVDACEQAIMQNNPHRLFRPPYGKMKPSQKRAVLARGYEIVLWDVLTHDYNSRYTPERMLKIVQKYTRDGSIINFHDSLKSAQRTIDVLPQVIEWLQAEGYAIQTL